MSKFQSGVDRAVRSASTSSCVFDTVLTILASYLTLAIGGGEPVLIQRSGKMINLRFGCEQATSQDSCSSRKRTVHAIRRNPGAVGIGAALLASAALLNAQTAASGTSQPGATQLPLSGRQSSTGSVSTTQSITNSGGVNSVNVINSTVNLAGPYSGSVPNGSPVDASAPLTLDNALKLGLRNNLAQVSQSKRGDSSEGSAPGGPQRAAAQCQFEHRRNTL
jgi:hypothetical protein